LDINKKNIQFKVPNILAKKDKSTYFGATWLRAKAKGYYEEALSLKNILLSTVTVRFPCKRAWYLY